MLTILLLNNSLNNSSKNFSHNIHQRIGSLSTKIPRHIMSNDSIKPQSLPEIIQIQGPNHSSTKAIVLHKVAFSRNSSLKIANSFVVMQIILIFTNLVIKPNPLVAIGGVGAHSGWTGVILHNMDLNLNNFHQKCQDLNNSPARLDVATDLVVGEETLGPCGNSCSSSISGLSIKSVILG